ncbi:MAG: zeta toxin family protein [Alphaproteobacteria bacterium]|nr:zeta toxin family protein [Alphaproteobacteria bacterium]
MTKWMVIIAGPNGAVKSTFYEKVLKTDPLLKNAPSINMDNIAKELANGDDPNKHMIDAGKIVIAELEKKLKSRKSFVYETTSSGKAHLKYMDRAQKAGFKIATIFIGLANVELSHLRVQQRVREGGHNVSAEDIERRYPNIIKNFPEMLKRSDVSAVFDNSGKTPFKLIFLMDESKLFIFHSYPKWVEGSLKERKTSKEMVRITNNKLKKMPAEKISNMINCVFEQFHHER